jgi:hypothetical protein
MSILPAAAVRSRRFREREDHALVVLAGRNPPSAGWREDPAWRELAQILPLRNLPPTDSRAYLETRGILRTRRA